MDARSLALSVVVMDGGGGLHSMERKENSRKDMNWRTRNRGYKLAAEWTMWYFSLNIGYWVKEGLSCVLFHATASRKSRISKTRIREAHMHFSFDAGLAAIPWLEMNSWRCERENANKGITSAYSYCKTKLKTYRGNTTREKVCHLQILN